MLTLTFVLALNCSFAADDNATDLAIDNVEEDIVEIDNVESQEIIADEVSNVSVSDEDLNINQSIKNGKVTDRYYDGVVYTVNFYDAYGSPLKNTNVYCGLNGLDYGFNTTTDSNGVAKFGMILSKGSYKLCLFNPLTQHISNDTIKVFSVLKGNKNINMYYDNGNTYTVRVYGDDGKPVKAGQKVTFYVGTKKYATKKTDKNGYAKLKITLKPGVYQVAAVYKNYVVNNRVTVKQVVKLSGFASKKLKSTFKYNIKFLGKNKKNKKITVKFNKKTYKAKTNKKGIAIFTLKTPKKVGQYKLVASYKKSKVTGYFTKYYA